MLKNKGLILKLIIATSVGLFISRICGVNWTNIKETWNAGLPYIYVIGFIIFTAATLILWACSLVHWVDTGYFTPECYIYDCVWLKGDWRTIKKFSKNLWNYECVDLALVGGVIISFVLAFYCGIHVNFGCADCVYEYNKGFDPINFLLLYPAWESIRFMIKTFKMVDIWEKEKDNIEKK